MQRQASAEKKKPQSAISGLMAGKGAADILVVDIFYKGFFPDQCLPDTSGGI
jgi:hypothetical protein